MSAAGTLIEMAAERGGAAVRQRAMARSTLICAQVSHWRLCSINFSPAARTRSATSSGGRSIYAQASFFSVADKGSVSRGLAVALRWR